MAKDDDGVASENQPLPDNVKTLVTMTSRENRQSTPARIPPIQVTGSTRQNTRTIRRTKHHIQQHPGAVRETRACEPSPTRNKTSQIQRASVSSAGEQPHRSRHSEREGVVVYINPVDYDNGGGGALGTNIPKAFSPFDAVCHAVKHARRLLKNMVG